MPSTIPFDHPSLVLGNVVNTQVLDLMKKAGGLQTKLDAAREKMNSLVMMKRSLAMTINELTDMNVDVTELKDTINNVDTSITKAATDYMTVCIDTQTGIQQYREQISALEPDDRMESPVDFTRSAIKRLPLSAESLQMDAQYFSFGSNLEDDAMANIEKYIRESTSNLGAQSGELAKTATAQINRQRQNHNLAGTLIITASCTHRNVAMIEPFVMDVDKAVTVWNSLYTGAGDKIDISDPAILKEQQEAAGTNEQSMTVLSGVVYGSGFIGMVHMLKADMTDSGPTETVAAQLQEKLKIGGWLENASGGFGIDASVMSEVKKMLSTQSVSSHVSMVVMGAVPSITSSQLKLGVKQVLQPDAEKLNGYLSTLSQNPASVSETVESGADSAKMGNRMVQVQTATMQSVMRSLGSIDQGSNKVLDINSLMTAFENYLQSIKEKEESTGVPIHFYIKKIAKHQLIQAWMEKYHTQNETTNPQK